MENLRGERACGTKRGPRSLATQAELPRDGSDIDGGLRRGASGGHASYRRTLLQAEQPL